MPTDYVPFNDDDLDQRILDSLTWLNVNYPQVGLTAAELAPLQGLYSQWDTDFGAFKNLRTLFRAGTQTKDATKALIIAAWRIVAQRIQSYSGTTDAIRTILGLTITTPGAPPPPPGSVPRAVPTVKSPDKLTQVVRWTNEATGRTPNPPGYFGVELYVKVGDPPTSLADMTLAGVDGSNPYTKEFDAADAGKMAHWVLRYTEKSDGSGNFGPQSEVESATILG